MNDKALVISELCHSFGTVEVLRDIGLAVDRNEFVALVGPSGCGKTTLLNILSGHERPSSGVVNRQGGVRRVYQQDGLFPWLTVTENILLGLRGIPARERRQARLGELLELIGLSRFADHYPHQLSGGMRQLVEVARAVSGESELLLLDEPFSSLDYLTRLRMRGALADILAARPRTVLLVSHDIEEAAQLADRMIVLTERPGRIRCELHIDLPRPRYLTHPIVVSAVHRALTAMGLERD